MRQMNMKYIQSTTNHSGVNSIAMVVSAMIMVKQ